MELQKPPLKVVYNLKASINLNNITDHISAYSRRAAREQYERILARVEMLREHPGMGKPAQEPEHAERGVRFTSEGKYYIFFLVEGQELHVLHVRHSARRSVSSFDLFGETDETEENE